VIAGLATACKPVGETTPPSIVEARRSPEPRLSPRVLLTITDVEGSVPAALGEGPTLPVVTDDQAIHVGFGNRVARFERDGSTMTTHELPRHFALLGGGADRLLLRDYDDGFYVMDAVGGATRYRGRTDIFGDTAVIGDEIAISTWDNLVRAPLTGRDPFVVGRPPALWIRHQPPTARGDTLAWPAAIGDTLGDVRLVLVARAGVPTIETLHFFDDPTRFITHVAWAGEALVFAVAHQHPDSTLSFSLHRKLGDVVEQVRPAAPGITGRLVGDGECAWWHTGGSSLIGISASADADVELDHEPLRLTETAAGLVWAEAHGARWRLLLAGPKAGDRDLGFEITDADATARPKPDAPAILDDPEPSNIWGSLTGFESHLRVRLGPIVVTGLLPPDVVRSGHPFGTIHECYAAGTRESPELAGRVTVAFTIGAGGSVVHAAAIGEPFANADVAACIVEAIAKTRFHAPLSAQVVVRSSIDLWQVERATIGAAR
jgi:hypothetical protein